LSWLERHLAIFPEPERVVVIGAGRGRDLPALTARAHGRIVLVEPQPRWADELRRRTRRSPGIEVIPCALDETSGEATLKVFNFHELTSLRPSPAVEAAFPGAHQTVQLPVEALSLSDLVRRCGIEPGPDNWLIVDAPGVLSALRAGLTDGELAGCFPHVVIRTHPAIGEESDPGSVTNAFLELDYQALGSDEDRSGDWSRLHFLRFNNLPLRRDLERCIHALERTVKSLTAENGKLQAQVSEARLDSEARKAEIRQREAQIRELEWSHAARVAELENQLASSRRERDQRLEHLHEVVDRKQANLSLSLRLQEQRENDLRELRGRYDALLESRNAQHELLSRVRERLGLAARTLQELKSENDEGRRNDLTRSLLSTLAHDDLGGE
jgi:FkbM family methyltransferase